MLWCVAGSCSAKSAVATAILKRPRRWRLESSLITWLVLTAVVVFARCLAVAAWLTVFHTPQRCRPHSPTRLSREAGNPGYMLFDFGAFSKEKFIVESMFELLSYGPPEVLGLEWQPEDGRAVRYLKPPAPGRLKEYCFAGKGYSSTQLENFNYQSFDDTPITFLEWAPSVGSISLKNDMVDVALISAFAIDALKPKGFQLALKESARILKPTGQLILFREEGQGGKKPLPEIVEALYTVNVTKSEGTLGLWQLLPKPKSSSRVRAKSRARAAPSAGARSASAPKRGNNRGSRS